mgnify:CR=1 FL=1
MILNEETFSPRAELSVSQYALLERRLQRARHASLKPAGPPPAIPRRGAADNLPLALAQERLWFLHQLEPRSAVYNLCQAVRLRGSLDIPALERGLNEIIRRHETLRTNFIATEGSPVQRIAASRTLALQLVDLAARPDAVREEELRWRLQEESRRPFDLARDLLLRALLVRIGPEDHALLLTMHHIVSDGWSLGLLLGELAAGYEAFRAGEPVALAELPVQYADYALWERKQLGRAALEQQLAYWKKQLGGRLPALELPTDHPRLAAPMAHGAARSLQLSAPLTQSLKTLSQQEGATLFMTLLAAFQVLLHRYTGHEDIVVGSVVAGRRQSELEKLIGFFVNTLVFRGDLSGNPTFRELLGRMREVVLGALAHQDLPFARLVEEMRPDRDLSRNPLFQVMLVLQNMPAAPAALPGLEVQPQDVDSGTAKFELTLALTESPDGLRAVLEYNADLFERETMKRMLEHFQALLEGIAANPDRRIAVLPVLTPVERQQVLVTWNDTRTEYPREKTIARLFAEQAAKSPDAVAVAFEGRTLTYRELEARSGELAGRLREVGVRAETLVGVCLERSLELVIALLGIVRAGGAYVSFDPAYPPERLAFMLDDTRAPVVLTQAKLRAGVDRFVAARPAGAGGGTPAVICLDAGWPPRAGKARAPFSGPELTADNLAYVSYTSGSTGRPKGVCVTHRGVVRLVKNPNFARFEAGEIFLQLAPVAFDASTLEIWGPLLNGGRLEVFRPGPASLAELGEAIQARGITTLWLTAGLFHQMVEEQIDRLQNVRQLLAGGDVLSVPHVTRALEHLPRTQLINGYGPTENTTFTCCHRITAPPAANRPVPIGRPVANTQVRILDLQLQPVPVGVPGELYTGGDGLARGYLNRPALTAEKFTGDPLGCEPGARWYRTGDRARWLPDGTIEFLGRMDRQVKIRGFRVEPAEIEAFLATHPAVRECAVVARDDASGQKRLVAYLVAPGTPPPAAGGWRGFLERKLPDYLIPSAFVVLPALPLSPNGKLELAALPEPDGGRPELQRAYVAPRDAVERQLAGIWEEVLGVHPVGVRDRFFDLGGHSLLAVRLVAQIERSFGKKLPVAAVFQHGTVEQLSPLLQAQPSRYVPPATSIVEFRSEGGRPPLFLVHGVGGGMFWGYANLTRHLDADQPVFGFKSRGLDGLEEWPTIEEMAAHYVADLQAFQPQGPYLLGGYCFGGNVAYEMARQLHAQGEQVALLALMNCAPPNTDYENPRLRWSPRWLAGFIGNFFYWVGSFLFRWTPRERREFVRWKLRLVAKKVTALFGCRGTELGRCDVDELVDLAAYADGERRLWETHVRALIRYHPQPYAGRVTLFRTRGHSLFCSFDENYGWGELAAGGVGCKIIPGEHGNILDEAHVGAMADEVRGCLQAPGGNGSGERKP